MKRNFVLGLFGSLAGFGMLLLLLSATGIVGARGADIPRDQARPEAVSTAPLTSTFTYQGQLKNGSSVVNNTACQMAFRLYDDPSASTNLIGSPITSTVPVTNGLFTVGLNFGSSAFDGNGRWLDIQIINCGSGFAQLTPRQSLTAAPYALFANNADLLDGKDSSAFINLSLRPALPGPGEATTVDSAGKVGTYTSITYGIDGLGLISYFDSDNSHLKVLHCGNAACNSGNISTTVDSASGVGDNGTSITIGTDGFGLISYNDSTNGHLKVLHCGNITCNSGNISSTVDSADYVGAYASLTIGADGLGLISYYYENFPTIAYLKVLHCGNTVCNSGNISTSVDTSASVGQHTSITIGTDGLGLISYRDSDNGHLKVLHCGNAA
jgi:hypothetical protein